MLNLAGAGCGVAASVVLWWCAARVEVRERTAQLRHNDDPRLLLAPTRIEASLARADIAQPVATVVRTWLLLAIAAGVLGASLNPMFGVLLVVLSIGGGPVLLVLARHRAERHAAESLPAFLRLIASELRIGGTVISALETVAESPHPLARDAARVRARLALGASLDDALRAWVGERPVMGARAAAGALTLASTVGGPAAEAVDGLAASLADRIAATAETSAQSAQARASALVMVLAPIGYLVFASTIDQRSLDVLLNTAFGRGCLAAGLLLDGLAVAWIRYLVRPEAEA